MIYGKTSAALSLRDSRIDKKPQRLGKVAANADRSLCFLVFFYVELKALKKCHPERFLGSFSSDHSDGFLRKALNHNRPKEENKTGFGGKAEKSSFCRLGLGVW